MENLYVEQSDCKRTMNFNTAEFEVLVEEVNTHCVKQRTREEQENLRENVNIYEELKRLIKKKSANKTGEWPLDDVQW